jgi:hypothetical protein
MIGAGCRLSLAFDLALAEARQQVLSALYGTVLTTTRKASRTAAGAL